MARNIHVQVPSYYAGRILHPIVARLVSGVAHVPIDGHLFRALSVFSLITFFLTMGVYYGLDYSATGSLWLILLCTATLVDQYRNYYWHDLFYAALCSLFFLALRSHRWLSVPFLLALYMTRESTIVLVFAVVVIAALRREWSFFGAMLAIGAAAMKVNAALVSQRIPSKQGISLLLWDALKVPYNFAYNICGIELWTNTDASTLPAPIWTAHVPLWLHLGNISEVGYCGFFWQRPVETLLILTTAFGILPLVIVRAAVRGRRSVPRFEVETALLFGGLMFILAPFQGTEPARYVLYGWPLFWIFGITLVSEAFVSWQMRTYVILLSLCVSWIPPLIRAFTGPAIANAESLSTLTTTGLILSGALVLTIYVVAWRILKVDTTFGEGTSRGLVSQRILSGIPAPHATHRRRSPEQKYPRG